MLLSGFIAMTILAPGQSGLTCPIMGGAADFKGEYTEYNGARFYYCCPGCSGQFESKPSEFLKTAGEKGKLIGEFLFDPVSGMRIDSKKSKASSDFKGIRFYFESVDNKATFDADPKKYGRLPAKEALRCPAMNKPIEAYSKASGYADYNGVRYYFCCAGCEKPFAADSEKLSAGAASYIQEPKAIHGKPAASDGGAQKPISFACRHCGKTVTLKSEADLDKKCTACACGMTSRDCKG